MLEYITGIKSQEGILDAEHKRCSKIKKINELLPVKHRWDNNDDNDYKKKICPLMRKIALMKKINIIIILRKS